MRPPKEVLAEKLLSLWTKKRKRPIATGSNIRRVSTTAVFIGHDRFRVSGRMHVHTPADKANIHSTERHTCVLRVQMVGFYIAIGIWPENMYSVERD